MWLYIIQYKYSNILPKWFPLQGILRSCLIFIFEINGKIDKINWIFRFFKSLSLWFLTFVLLTCTLYYYTSLYMNICIGLCIVTWPYTVIDVFSDNIKISHGLVDNTIFSFFFSLQEIAMWLYIIQYKYSYTVRYNNITYMSKGRK
jgi:hypothetical protein